MPNWYRENPFALPETYPALFDLSENRDIRPSVAVVICRDQLTRRMDGLHGIVQSSRTYNKCRSTDGKRDVGFIAVIIGGAGNARSANRTAGNTSEAIGVKF